MKTNGEKERARTNEMMESKERTENGRKKSHKNEMKT